MQNYFLILFTLCIFFQAHAQIQNKPLPREDEGSMGMDVNDSMYVFNYVNEMPKFQEGNDSLFIEYIQKRIVYPKDAKDLKIEGRVFVQYIIEKDGSVSNVAILKGYSLYPSLDQTAVDIIKNSPKWKSGLNNGKPVRVKKVTKVQFSLS